MKLYNQLTRSIQEFTPIEAGKVRIYSCGPTVYDHIQIGNLLAYICSDTLHRTLAHAGFEVTRAMNYTDVDDKTIRRSREDFPDLAPHDALQQLTDKYIDIFHRDMRAIGNDIDSLHFLSAVENIPAMQAMIADLHAQGFAYITDDGVYFSIDAYRKSGKTYGQLLKLTVANTSEARIDNDEYDKDSVHDFALWKTHKAGEPFWKFSLDGQQLDGRPGWHIECSAMSQQAVGQPFDIHTGGIDNMFPHHENEIAQSTATSQSDTLANFFVYNNHLLVDGKKMSKSAKNFYRIADIMAKGFEPLAFRLVVLQSHYQSQLNFTWDSLQAAQNRLVGLRAMADLRFQSNDSAPDQRQAIEQARADIAAAMHDNLNTPRALAVLSEIEAVLSASTLHHESTAEFNNLLNDIDALFGLKLRESHDINDAQKATIAKRRQARDNGNFASADELRTELLGDGIELRDTPYGAIWSRR